MIGRLSFPHRNPRLAGCVAAAVSAVLLLASAGSAKASTTIGYTAAGSCGYLVIGGQVQDVAPRDSIPFDGVITSFAAGSDAAGVGMTVKLLILTPVSGTTYNVAAKSDAGTFTAAGVQSFPARVTARTGQLIGDYGYACGNVAGAVFHSFGGPEPALGADQDFPTTVFGGRANLSATLERDADRDGFGDETQDQCPTDATTAGPCPQAAARAENRKCRHLRRKLKRQKARLEKAGTDKKRSMIQANIEDTKRRQEKLGCK